MVHADLLAILEDVKTPAEGFHDVLLLAFSTPRTSSDQGLHPISQRPAYLPSVTVDRM